HQDGVKMLKGAFDTNISMLQLENKELYLAIKRQRELNVEAGIKLEDFRFRTMLTSDFYFYGLNHEVSNIDSKSIYVISKSEKLIARGHDGGFIVFPDLMRVLSFCFPDLESFFDRCVVDKTKASPQLSRF